MTLQERAESFAATSTALLAQICELIDLHEQIQRAQATLIDSIDPKPRRQRPSALIALDPLPERRWRH